MATIDGQRHQMIRRIVLRRQASPADLILLWEQLAGELTAIIGHAGFCTLYGRAVQLANATHAGMPATADADFERLRDHLALQAPAQAAEINIVLLTIFIDTLIRLIGAPLTTTILHSAWGADAVETAGNEPQQ